MHGRRVALEEAVVEDPGWGDGGGPVGVRGAGEGGEEDGVD